MTHSEIEKIFESFGNLKVGVIGDFALDIYYDLNRNTGEFSFETGKPVFYGTAIKSELGAAGNIVNNIVSLGVNDVSVFGLVGNDILGRELEFQLNDKKVNTINLITVPEDWETYSYFKPIERKDEGSRLDFGSSNKKNDKTISLLLDALKADIGKLDVLIVNQQFVNPMIDVHVFNELNKIIQLNPDCLVFGDLRKDLDKLVRGTLKVNAVLISMMLNIDPFDEKDSDLCIEMMKKLQEIVKNPLFMTRGESGLIYVNRDEVITVPGIYLTGDLDQLGRGNTCISAFAACLGSGADIGSSLEIANLAYAIIVKRINRTGSASPEEILKLAQECYYNYDLALAHDPRKAEYIEGTDIELVDTIPANLNIHNVIFDHDGTISTLREGWEAVMHDVMMQEICGDHLKSLPTDEYNRISQKCQKFINDTTGIQTIVQMHGLRKIVIEEGYIGESLAKTGEEYKKIFLNKLMVSVNDRIERFNRSERHLHDFSVLNSVEMLSELHERGLTLYLASGTDEENVKVEANALGYGHMFEGGIFGSQGNEIGDAKRIVIGRIIKSGKCEGKNLMVIGDGPVEIIEGRRVGAFCVGVASDEVRRHGINYGKRTRLIRAGAHLIIPDFSQYKYLLNILFQS